jgi:hypothetical protein
MNADEIVKALRLCGETTDCVVERIGCPYYENTDDCKDELLFDAADLIEAQLELQELAKAKAEGRLVVLPCKVGTRVWVIGQDCDLCHDMYTEEPCLFGDCEYRKVIESVFLPGMTDEFGKTVFLTREEAEKAIAEVGE